MCQDPVYDENNCMFNNLILMFDLIIDMIRVYVIFIKIYVYMWYQSKS